MTRLTRLCRAVGVGLAAATAALAMTQVAQAAPPAPPPVPPRVPPALAVPRGNQVFLVGHVSKGVQTYTCNAGSWGTSVPTADLVDDRGKLIVKHSAGPTWTSTADHSAVLGAKKASAPSPASPPAIDWLLLSTTPVTGARTGLLTDTTFIQRVNTHGGTAPPIADCTTNGKVVAVPYKADYYFWRAAGKPGGPGGPGGHGKPGA